MKRIPRRSNFLRTASTTSTTGPHVRLVQNFGVAKTTTNGACARSASATEYRRRPVSGGTRVVSCESFPFELAIVGVFDGYAFAPTSGADECAFTTRFW